MNRERIEYIDLGANTAYIVKDGSLFLPTEYKVLQGQTCFIKCMKMLFNNDLQFFYYTQNYRALSTLLDELNPFQFERIVIDLIAKVVDVHRNGFLCCESIDIALNRIYIDTASNQVYFLYIPTRQRLFEHYAHFENELRNNIMDAIKNAPSLSKDSNLISLMTDLSNSKLSIEKIYKSRMAHFQGNQMSELQMVPIGGTAQNEILINEDEFIIGRNVVLLDEIGTVDKDISRKHCMVHRINHTFMISDLESTNGTFVNGTKLQPYKQCHIHSGDIVRIANRDFRVEIKD